MGITVRSNNFRADVSHTVDGKTQRWRQTFDNIVDAQAWMGVAKKAMINGQPEPQPNSGSTTTKFTFKAFADRCFNLHWKDKSQPVKKQKMIKAMVSFFGEKTLIEDITFEKITDFVLHCDEDKSMGGLGNAGGTINRKLSTISVIMKQAFKEGKIPKMPSIDKLKENGGRQRWLTKEEAKEMLEVAENYFCDLDLYHGMKVSLDTGVRAGELIKIRRQDITEQGLIIPVRKSKKLPTMIPLTTKARAILEVRCKMTNGDRLFPFGDSWYKTSFNNLKDSNKLAHLDLSDVCWHTLRHTTCSWLIQGGINLVRVQQLMGHSNISTTMRYAHLAPINSAEYISPLEE